jgi:hypothetical protein
LLVIIIKERHRTIIRGSVIRSPVINVVWFGDNVSLLNFGDDDLGWRRGAKVEDF